MPRTNCPTKWLQETKTDLNSSAFSKMDPQSQPESSSRIVDQSRTQSTKGNRDKWQSAKDLCRSRSFFTFFAPRFDSISRKPVPSPAPPGPSNVKGTILYNDDIVETDEQEDPRIAVLRDRIERIREG